jgi:hypothetical protein
MHSLRCRAEALRRAMIALMIAFMNYSSNPESAHSAFWPPCALIGEWGGEIGPQNGCAIDETHGHD